MRDGHTSIEQRRQSNNMNADSIRQSLFSTSNGYRPAPTANPYSRSGLPSSGSNYARPAPSSSGSAGLYAEQSEHLMESQNDDLTARLADKVSVLKQLSIDIGLEVKEQNKMLTDMDVDFEKAQGMLKKTLGGLQKMIQTGGSKHMCYLVMFIFALFMLVYWLVR